MLRGFKSNIRIYGFKRGVKRSLRDISPITKLETRLERMVYNAVSELMCNLTNTGWLGGPDPDTTWKDDEGHYHYEWYSDAALRNVENMLEKICKKLEIEHKGPWDWMDEQVEGQPKEGLPDEPN